MPYLSVKQLLFGLFPGFIEASVHISFLEINIPRKISCDGSCFHVGAVIVSNTPEKNRKKVIGGFTVKIWLLFPWTMPMDSENDMPQFGASWK